jgi:hypothetical protein
MAQRKQSAHGRNDANDPLASHPSAVVVSTNLAAIAVQKLSRTVPTIGTGLNAPVAMIE